MYPLTSWWKRFAGWIASPHPEQTTISRRILSPCKPVAFDFSEHRRLLETLFGGEHRVTAWGPDHISLIIHKKNFQKWQQEELDVFVRQIF